MPDDDLPPAPSESADEAAKAETIRITLPAKPETPTAKRETVRINLPGKAPGTGITPKKETTKIVTESSAAAFPAAAPTAPGSASRPSFPPPPRPPGAAGAPPPPSKPMSGINPPPKPPMLGKPGMPMKPGIPTPGIKPAAPSASAIQPADPVTQRAAAPKKETARITLPTEGGKPALPKATVKMQQTQPLVRQPSASTIQAAPMIQTAPASVSSVSSAPASDGLLNFLAIITFVVAIGAVLLAYLAYNSALLS